MGFASMDFALSPQHEEIRRTVRDFAEKRDCTDCR